MSKRRGCTTWYKLLDVFQEGHDFWKISTDIKLVSPKGNQSWIFIGRIDAKAEVPLATWWEELTHWKDSDAGKDWRQEEKGTTEDEMVGWNHWLNGHEFEQTPGVVDEQGGLVCCDSWGRKGSDRTERLNWTELALNSIFPKFTS